GAGTTIRLIFPARTVAAGAKNASSCGGGASVPASHGSSIAGLPALRVLCIDDEPLLRDMLKQLLENGGHTVEVADGGRVGLELFRAANRRGAPFDVVITDLGMPHLDGRQLSQALKHESAHTPIIMLTGWGSFLKEDGDIPPQVDAMLTKPPKILELYDILA